MSEPRTHYIVEPFGWFAEWEFARADGSCECPVCGQTYSRHPHYPLCTIFHILCDGKLVKL